MVSLIAILLLVLSPLLIPVGTAVTHALRSVLHRPR